MLPSTGYFKAINCPFYESGTCDRPYCHFKHSKRGKSCCCLIFNVLYIIFQEIYFHSNRIRIFFIKDIKKKKKRFDYYFRRCWNHHGGDRDGGKPFHESS